MEERRLGQQLEALPARPGVYLFKDAEDNVLYVGKAASLYHRVLSYFSSSYNHSAKTKRLMAQVCHFDIYVTSSVQEAILLESSLIFETGSSFKPSFLIVDENETRQVYSHASSFGKHLAKTMEESYADIEKSYQNLEMSNDYGFDDIAFLLVGGRIVDIHLLGKLVADVRLIPPAPIRPSPCTPAGPSAAAARTVRWLGRRSAAVRWPAARTVRLQAGWKAGHC